MEVRFSFEHVVKSIRGPIKSFFFIRMDFFDFFDMFLGENKLEIWFIRVYNSKFNF